MHFGENQLSPRSIGISPLPTGHPSGLQSTPVRASTPCYRRFTLPMGSSRGFGSTRSDLRPLQTRFRSGSGCNCLNLPLRVTRRIILQKARRQAGLRPSPPTAWKHTVSGSVSLPSPGFFSPFPHGTVRYRSLCVFSLGEWAPQLQTGLLVSGPTQDGSHAVRTARTRLSRSLAASSKRLTVVRHTSRAGRQTSLDVLQPPRRNGCRLGTARVWAAPGSLATTTGILSVPRGT
jgi:hypothetical protein